MLLNFCMSHVHAFFMHTLYLFFSGSWCVLLSLSLSRIDSTMSSKACKSTPAQNPLHGSGHPHLILLFPFIFGSVMRRPRWTSLRTSKTVVFIRNARSFCRTSPTLLYPKSFGLGDRSPSVGNPRDVWSCSFKSFTPTCTTSIPLYLVLLPHSKVHVS